jgi:hypothetical protein
MTLQFGNFGFKVLSELGLFLHKQLCSLLDGSEPIFVGGDFSLKRLMASPFAVYSYNK